MRLAACDRLGRDRKENMLETLRMIRSKYGSVEEYVTDYCLVSRATVDRLRRNLTVEVTGDHEVLNWRANAELVARV